MISIIDYGMGNLRSVQKALEYIGYEAIITKEPKDILDASHVILPGVGAFRDAMKSLDESGMIDVIDRVESQGKPFLGICLGMQLLFDKSCEGGQYDGLSLIPGDVKRISPMPGLKVPHMGWNILDYRESAIFDGIGSEPNVYFVHSYYLDTPYEEYVIGTTDYGGTIQVAVNRDNVYGLQFHPEKSGDVGLQILKNFGRMT